MVWRRAVALTRKRIEASVPLTLTEIQADKDRMRAEFAMATRRLEISFKNFREKAAAQIVEINRNREELKQLMAERSERHEALTRLEAQAGEVRAELRRREDELQVLTEKLDQAENLLEQRASEIEKLGRMYDDASFTASSRQLEIVARESEIEKLNNDMATLRSERREIDRRNQEIAAESRAAREALKAEQERALALEARIERLLATIADRDEKLDRGEREVARMRDTVKASSGAEGELQAQVAALQAEKAKLESEKAEMARTARNLRLGREEQGDGEADGQGVGRPRPSRRAPEDPDAREPQAQGRHRRARADEIRGVERRATAERDAARADERTRRRGGQADRDAGRSGFADQRGARPASARPTTTPARRSPAWPTRCARCRRRLSAG